MLHLNDSKTPIGSNRDRHENIGEGEIGLEGFRAVVTNPALAGLPGILEVPGFDGEGPDVLNVQRSARPGDRRGMIACAPRLRERGARWVYSACAATRRRRPGLRGDAMELVPVTTVNDAGLANVVRGVLEQAGIESAVSGGMVSAYPMPSVNPFQILVREEDVERARDVLAQFETMPDEDEGEE